MFENLPVEKNWHPSVGAFIIPVDTLALVPSSDKKPEVQQLGRLLQQLVQSHEHLSHACAENQGLYLTDFRALQLIWAAQLEDRHLTAGELASHLHLSSGAVTYLVERLSQSGHVTREADPKDRRKVLLKLSETGIQSAENFSGPLKATLGSVLSDMDPQAVADVLTVLERVNQGIQAHTIGMRAGGTSR